jgi:hypothetical protein
MKRYLLAVLIVVLVGVLLGSAVPAHSAPELGIVAQHVAVGGRYQLTVTACPQGVIASGGGYWLLSPSQPLLRGNGCCCIYLPTVKSQ